ncbi:hypothetical protein KLPMMMO221M1_26135 [Klebsiella pneumoniae]
MVCPREYIGGNVALTATAATFFTFGSILFGNCTPNWRSILVMVWLVNLTWFLSPVPSRPTTRL